MSKRITLLFPDAGNKPSGGHKVILQYANEFAKLGYHVNVVYSCYYPLPLRCLHKVLRYFKYSFRYLCVKISNDFSCRRWFDLNPSIKVHYVWSLYSSWIPKSDYYFATAAVTAKSLNRFNVPEKNKLYFVQGYEPWQIGEVGLIETYKLSCQKIVVSQWLMKLIDKYTTHCYYIPNGFDHNDFRIIKPAEERTPNVISILYHELVDKGFSIGFDTLQMVKTQVPNLRVLSFGVFDKPSYFPDWFEYYQNPDKELHNWINNEASIYLGTSSREGYGLTIGEAMMCGQAVVCTDNDGYLEMAVPNENALVCPVGDSKALANAIVRLISDKELRISLAKKGNAFIQDFSIEKSFSKLKDIVL